MVKTKEHKDQIAQDLEEKKAELTELQKSLGEVVTRQ